MPKRAPERVWVDCQNCHGEGHQPAAFDDIQGWVYRACAFCGGQGIVRQWVNV